MHPVLNVRSLILPKEPVLGTLSTPEVVLHKRWIAHRAAAGVEAKCCLEDNPLVGKHLQARQFLRVLGAEIAL